MAQTGYLASALEKIKPLAKYNLTSCGVRVEGSSGDGLQRPRLDDPRGLITKALVLLSEIERALPVSVHKMINK